MDFLTWIFVGPFGLRGGWRVLLWWIAYLVLSIAVIVASTAAVASLALALKGGGRETFARVAESLAVRDPSSPSEVLLLLSSNALQLLPAVAATWLLLRFLDRRGLRNGGLGGPARPAARSFGWGTAIGALCIGVAYAVLTAAGVVRTAGAGESVLATLAAGLLLLPAAAYEEVIFRGYPFQWLVRSVGFWPIAIASSLLFGLVHGWNPNAGVLSSLVVVGAGILLCVARVVRDDLWLPIGLHWGWNLAQGVVLGLPVSGLEDLPSPVDLELVGPAALSGAGFGIEGSVAGFLSIAAGFAGIWFMSRGRRLDWRLGAEEVRRSPPPERPGEGASGDGGHPENP